MTTLDDGPPPIRLFPLFLKFLRFGALAFGGPVAQIAMVRQALVDDERWIDSGRFNRLLALGKPQDFHCHVQSLAHQTEVIGADALIAIAVTGDVDGLVVINGDPHPQAWMRRQPLLFGIVILLLIEAGDQRMCQLSPFICSQAFTGRQYLFK